ncbi:MAG: hypothetical protein JSR90_06730 [Proteobacteria bacterium]|nr:hypothetical protein [Pseudomonadota bacterium]
MRPSFHVLSPGLPSFLRLAATMLAVVGFSAIAPGHAGAQEKTRLPPTAATCKQLAEWLSRYDTEKGAQHLSGRRFRADVGSALCTAGDYARGVAMLEKEVRDAGYPFPSP